MIAWKRSKTGARTCELNWRPSARRDRTVRRGPGSRDDPLASCSPGSASTVGQKGKQMKLIRLAIMAVWALVGCGGEPGEDEDPVEWGHDAQSIVTRSSASGARTWGSKPVFVSPVNTQPSCTKPTTGNCFFFATPPPGGAAATIKVRVLSAGFTSSQVTFLNGVVDTWVSNMRTLTSSSQTPMSFSRAVSGENVQIVSNDLGGATSSKYNRYAFPDLSQCTALIPKSRE